MKAGISNIWVLGLMVVFLLVFAAYITVSINYTASFKMKNEILNIIEKHHGMTNQAGHEVNSTIIKTRKVTGEVGTLQTINLYLQGNHYQAKGECNNELATGHKWYGMKTLNYKNISAGTDYERITKPDTKYYYCFAKYKSDRFAGLNKDELVEYRYKFKMFFRFDMPALSEFLAIQVQGTTNPISHTKDSDVIEYNTD